MFDKIKSRLKKLEINIYVVQYTFIDSIRTRVFEGEIRFDEKSAKDEIARVAARALNGTAPDLFEAGIVESDDFEFVRMYPIEDTGGRRIEARIYTRKKALGDVVHYLMTDQPFDSRNSDVL